MEISRKWLKEASPTQLDECFESKNASDDLKLAIMGEYAVRRSEVELAKKRAESHVSAT